MDSEHSPVTKERIRVALKAFRYIMAQWGCNEAEQKQLLGLDQVGFDRLMGDEPAQMSGQLLQRISCIMGIARALDALYPTNDRAAARIRKPTSDDPFQGLSPLAFVLADPEQGLTRTRRYFDWKAQV